MATATPVDHKRKRTVPNLEIVTIDEQYDLTIIAGSPEHPNGQNAFRINKGSPRNVNPVWAKMLNGSWAESSKSEIDFPDDSCDAFHIVLRIAHFQLSLDELLDLAMFSDNYNLETAVRMAMEFKRWTDPYRKRWHTWLEDTNLPEFTVITSAFKLKSDFDYQVNRLAICVENDAHDNMYYQDRAGEEIMLSSDLPTPITGKPQRQLFRRTLW